MDLQELKNKILDLEKGYKELSHWHDKNKMQFMDTYFSNKKIHEELMKNQKRQTDFQEQVVNYIENAMEGIIQINERLQRLEEKT